MRGEQIILEFFQDTEYDIDSNMSRVYSELRFKGGDLITYQADQICQPDLLEPPGTKDLVLKKQKEILMRRLSGEEAREEIAKLQDRIKKLEAKKWWNPKTW